MLVVYLKNAVVKLSYGDYNGKYYLSRNHENVISYKMWFSLSGWYINELYQCVMYVVVFILLLQLKLGAQWLSGRVLDSIPRGRGFEPHRRHWVVVLEQDTFILA